MDKKDPNRKEIAQKVSDFISSKIEVEQVILFGSVARGDFVSDTSTEGHITYQYESDIDLLVLVASSKLKEDSKLWNDIKSEIRSILKINAPISLLVDTVGFVTQKLSEGNYFYSDVIKEGVKLFDSKRYDLSKTASVGEAQKKVLAKEDFEFWTKKADDFLRDYEHNLADGSLNNGAFHLSQAAESLYFAVLLVFSGYKPKSHNIEKIEEMVSKFVPEITTVFDKSSEGGAHLFDLLAKAYIDARYKKDYRISEDDLEKLHKKLLKLKAVVLEACAKKLNL